MSKSDLHSNSAICCTVALFIVLGITYSLCTPLWVPPDEVRHFAYSEYIVNNHALPYLKPGDERGYITQSVHPPLYYVLMAVFFRDDSSLIHENVTIDAGPGPEVISQPREEARFPYAGKALTAHLIRLASVLFGACTVLLVYCLALKLFPGERLLGLASAVFVATLPQFLHVSASVSNENLSTALAVLYLLLLVDLLEKPSQSSTVRAGIVLGLCFLAKTSTFLYIPVTGCMLVWKFRQDGDVRHWYRFATIMAIAGLLSSWWFIRNWIVFDDLFFTHALEQFQPWSMRPDPWSRKVFSDAIPLTFKSFFGYFGSLQFPMKPVHYIAYLLLPLASGAGLLRLILKKASVPLRPYVPVLLAVTVVFGLLMYASMNLRYVMFMGRYFFVIIAPLSILFCLGVQSVFPAKTKKLMMILFMIGLTGLSIDVFFRVIRPAFSPIPMRTVLEQQAFCCRTDWLSDRNRVSQTFIAPEDNLACIGVLLMCREKPSSGTLQFSLEEIPGGNLQPVISAVRITGRDGLWLYYFLFPALKESKGKTYRFTLAASASLPPPRAALMYEERDACAGGEMTVNGERVPGDLFFRLFAAEETPDLVRAASGSTIVTCKRFIEFFELQLYYEMPERLKKTSVTRQKILLFEKALKNIYR